ncbi:MAG: FAD-dependent oxidoreductase, partial [Myxococcota bacterium]
MFLDSNQALDNGAHLEADVCIVGAGAAGITLALELQSSGLSVLLLESGGFTMDDNTQQLYSGDGGAGVADIGLTTCRARVLGGSTHWWAGWCRMLDPDVFEVRDWMPYSGWPIDRAALMPFYQRAHQTLQLGVPEYDVHALSEALGRTLLTLDETLAAHLVYQYSTPMVRFGHHFRSDLESSEAIDVLLFANLTEIVLTEQGDAVSRLECATLMGRTFSVSADRIVLAMGGVETPRILLASNRQEPDGIGNAFGHVGRFFMEHPHYYSGSVLVVDEARDTALYEQTMAARMSSPVEGAPAREVHVRAALGLSADQRRRAQLMGLAATLKPFNPANPAGRAEQLAAETVGQLLSAGMSQANQRYLALDLRCEQRPHPDSRITLTDDRDALGVPRVRLRWLVTDEDRDSVARTLKRLAAALGVGMSARLWMPLDEADLYHPVNTQGGCHHMGTARMSALP